MRQSITGLSPGNWGWSILEIPGCLKPIFAFYCTYIGRSDEGEGFFWRYIHVRLAYENPNCGDILSPKPSLYAVWQFIGLSFTVLYFEIFVLKVLSLDPDLLYKGQVIKKSHGKLQIYIPVIADEYKAFFCKAAMWAFFSTLRKEGPQNKAAKIFFFLGY